MPNGIQKIKCNAKLAPYIGINTGCTLMHVFFKSSCNELLENGGHHGNIRQLAIEMFDVSTGLSPENIRFFQFKEEIH